MDDLEAGHRVALGQGLFDPHRPGVPQVVVEHPHRGAHRAGLGEGRELREVRVRLAVVRLRIRHLGLVAPDGRVEPRGGAAVVGMSVAEHDPFDAAHRSPDRGDVARHVAHARVEDGHAAIVLDEVDVHDPLDERRQRAAAHEPDAVGHALHRHGGRSAPHPLAHVLVRHRDRRYESGGGDEPRHGAFRAPLMTSSLPAAGQEKAIRGRVQSGERVRYVGSCPVTLRSAAAAPLLGEGPFHPAIGG